MNYFIVIAVLHCLLGAAFATSSDGKDKLREKRGYSSGYGHDDGAISGGSGNYLIIGGGHGGDKHGPSGADIANQAAVQATAAAAGLKGAAHAAAGAAAATAAAASAAAAQTAKSAAASLQAEAAHITQAAQGAQAAAFTESSLAAKADVAEQAAKVTASMAKGLATSLAYIAAEANGLAEQASNSLGIQEKVSIAQNGMAWEAQQAANNLNQKQAIILNELQSVHAAAAKAKGAATKALAKAKGTNLVHSHGNVQYGGYGSGYY